MLRRQPRHVRVRARLERRARKAHRPARRPRWWRTLLLALLVGTVLAALLRTYGLETFYVPSQSMAPTLLPGDRILVDKLPWVAADVHRGDVIVFHRPPGFHDTAIGDLVKRVIGLPGDVVSSRGDVLYVDGRRVAEPYLRGIDSPVGREFACPQKNFDIKRTVVPAHSYFVLGDCRGVSDDSRYWGFVPAHDVVGKAFAVVWRAGRPTWRSL